MSIRQPSRLFMTTFALYCFVGVAGAAWAYWTGSGTGPGSGSTGTLNPPASVVATYTAGSTGVGVSWTGVTSPGSGTFGYFVERLSGTTPSPACGTSSTSLTVATSCTDTTVTNGTYTYRVTAVFRTWTARSAASNSVIVNGDTTPPTVPTPTVTAGYYTSLSVPVTLGTATDAGTGVNAASSVLQRDQVALTNGACGVFPGTFATTVTLVSGNDTSVSSGFCYRYREQVADNAGNVGTSATSNTAKVDTTAPSAPLTFSAFTNTSAGVTTLYYRPGATSGSVTVTASSTDSESGVASYTFPTFGTGWTVTGTGASRTYSWTTANPTTTTGSKSVTVTNNAGLSSSGTQTNNPFTLTADSTLPTATITFPANAGSYNPTTWAAGCNPIGFCGTASDAASGVASVAVGINRLSDNTWWNGTTWQSAVVGATSSGTTSWTQAFAASNLTNNVSYAVYAQPTDNVGNVGASVNATFTYYTGPNVTITSLNSGGASSRVTTSGTATVGDGNVTIYLCHTAPCSTANAVYTGSATVAANGSWSDTSPNIGTGTYYATALQTDAGANTGSANNFGPFTR